MNYIVLVLLFCLCLFFPVPAVYSETIERYHTEYVVSQNGRVSVEETILYDFGMRDRHGLLRKLPLTKTNGEGKQFLVGLTEIRVENTQGAPYTYTVNESAGEYTLKIGDANIFVHGKMPYRLFYTLSGALTYFSDHDELYWNTVGTQWEVPIQSASASVILPNSIEHSQITAICFAGRQGSTDQTGCTTKKNGNTVEFSSTRTLAAGEGMTVGVRFPKGHVAVLEPTPLSNPFDNPVVVLFMLAGACIWYMVLPCSIVYRWWKHGRDPAPSIGQAHVGFDIPKHDNGSVLTPAEYSFLLNETLSPAAITATIIDLAHKGVLTITQENNTWILTKNEGNSIPLAFHENVLMQGLFSEDNRVSIQDISLYPEYISIKKDISARSVAHRWFVKNPELQRQLYSALILMGFFTANLPLLLTSALFGVRMPKRTLKGANVTAYAKALKTFLLSQEKQYTFQAKDVYLFEKLLPYAISLGIEKIWARRFAHLTVPQPQWYKTTDTFTPLAFTNTLSQQMHTVSNTMSTTSSSSGFSSGFSGGSSGGGGGGGGGGSW
jgi:uncharacterized membrane protein YgcG